MTAYWAAAKTGIVIVPMSTLLQERGLASLLRDSDSIVLLADASFAEALDRIRGELPAMRADRFVLVGCKGDAPPGFGAYEDFTAGGAEDNPPDPGLTGADLYNIMYSSGTTGAPKGIVHLGGTYILHESFNAEQVIRDIEREQVTHIVMVPSQIIAVLNSPAFTPAALASLEMIHNVGAPLLLEYKHRLNEVLPGRFYELYGLTEGFVTVLDKHDAIRKVGSVGVPPPFFEMRILRVDGTECAPGEVGEICGKGPLLTPGYYKRPDQTEKAIIDGWLRSGDAGYVDEDGYLFLVDRIKDLIITGGVNVYPKDIEEVMIRHPAVVEVAVFGVPDEKWGETPVAAVVLRSGETIEPEALKQWTNSRVDAKFQRVSDVVVMDAFPCNAAGKMLKREMRDSYRRQRALRP
jgi:acyl-CoA synthetase (AMP-forming)/AMP-acid ligase II